MRDRPSAKGFIASDGPLFPSGGVYPFDVQPDTRPQRPDYRALLAYLLILAAVAGVFVAVARWAEQTVNLVAAPYMLTPALAALVVRRFVYRNRFEGAALRPGPWRRYGLVWLAGLVIVLFYYASFVAAGAVTLDFSGRGFLEQIEAVQPGASEALLSELPPGWSVRAMLLLYTIGGLTVFNLPGIVLGFGEEFGWRGFLFPQLYALRPWVAFWGGGLLWYAWHLPLGWLAPGLDLAPSLQALNVVSQILGAVATHALFAWLLVRTGSIWVPSLFHVVVNNGSRALSYWVDVQHPVLANAAIAAIMLLVLLVLWRTGRWNVFATWPARASAGPRSAAQP